MTYFRFVCLFLAALILFSRILFPFKKYPGNASLKTFPVKRPLWVDIILFLTFIVTALAWQKTLIAPSTVRWVLTVIMSMTFVKMLLWMFFYPSFRKMALTIYQSGKRLALINIASLIAFVAVLSVAFIYF